MGLRLEDFRKPLEEVAFLSGTKIVPVPFGPPEYALWREIERKILHREDPEGIGQACFQIIRACYPGVTDDDILDCTAEMLMALAAYPGGKIEEVRNALKNAVAVGETAATQAPPPQEAAAPSSPKTSGATSSRSMRKRSGKTGSTSTIASHTGDQSTSGSLITTSTSPNASTHFVESSTTSTAPS